MKLSKAIKRLEARRDWLIKKAIEGIQGKHGLFVSEAIATQIAIETLQEVSISGVDRLDYIHPELDDLRSMQSASDLRAFRKMEGNVI